MKSFAAWRDFGMDWNFLEAVELLFGSHRLSVWAQILLDSSFAPALMDWKHVGAAGSVVLVRAHLAWAFDAQEVYLDRYSDQYT